MTLIDPTPPRFETIAVQTLDGCDAADRCILRELAATAGDPAGVRWALAGAAARDTVRSVTLAALGQDVDRTGRLDVVHALARAAAVWRGADVEAVRVLATAVLGTRRRDDALGDADDEREPWPEVERVRTGDGAERDVLGDGHGRRVAPSAASNDWTVTPGGPRYWPRNRPSTRLPATRDVAWTSPEMDARRRAAGVSDRAWEAVVLVKARGLRPVQAARRLKVSRQRVHTLVREALQKLGRAAGG